MEGIARGIPDDIPMWQNVFLKAHAHGSPQILQSTNLSFGIRDCFSDGWSHLIPMDTSRIMHALKGTRLEINLNSEGWPLWFQCVQLPGSDLAAGAMKMMTALSQRKRSSHFSGDCEPAVAPSHPWGGNYGSWRQEKKPRLPKQTTSVLEKCGFLPPSVKALDRGSWTQAFLTKSVSFCICFPPSPSSSGTSSFFNLLSPLTYDLLTSHTCSDGLP